MTDSEKYSIKPTGGKKGWFYVFMDGNPVKDVTGDTLKFKGVLTAQEYIDNCKAADARKGTP